MIKKTLRVKDETAEFIERGAKAREIGEGEFLDLVAQSWRAGGETEQKAPEKIVTIAEELELPNGLLKIARDPEGLPEGFVRAKISESWAKIDWKRLEKLNVEVQGLKKDKLQKEVERLDIANRKALNRAPPGVRHSIEMEKDTAEAGGFVRQWCIRDRITIDSPEELEAHKASGCTIRELEPGELWEAQSHGRVWKGAGFDG